jgi:hypothetical protein
VAVRQLTAAPEASSLRGVRQAGRAAGSGVAWAVPMLGSPAAPPAAVQASKADWREQQ